MGTEKRIDSRTGKRALGVDNITGLLAGPLTMVLHLVVAAALTRMAVDKR